MEPPLLMETDHRFTLDVSTIPGAGLGLFARVGLAQGDTLEVPGVLVPAESISILRSGASRATTSRNTISAVGERQMFPRHTKRIFIRKSYVRRWVDASVGSPYFTLYPRPSRQAPIAR